MTTNDLMLSNGQLNSTTEVRIESWIFISITVLCKDHMKMHQVPQPVGLETCLQQHLELCSM